jgi:SAM-dependent methyltransferase
VTLDYSPTAVGLARERLAARDNVQALIGSIPQNLPAGQFELIVASEILYYLASADVAATVGWVASALKPGGTLVCVHWRRHGPERPLTAEAVHTTVRNSPALIWTRSGSTDEYLLDSFQRR